MAVGGSDPRPDLAEDSAAWERLLTTAACSEAAYCDPCGLYAALNGLRCCGGRLVHDGDRWLILQRPPDPGADETQEALDAELARDKRRWLMPHREVLLGLLAAVGNTEAKAS